MITTPQKNRLAKFLYGHDLDTKLSPNNFYIGLSTDVLGEDGVIKGEVTGQGYERKIIANTADSFSTPVAGVVHNTINVEWNEAEESWGRVRTVFFTDAKESQEALYYITVDRDVPAYSIIYFKGNAEAGDLNFSINN